jgi:hypothetical protein
VLSLSTIEEKEYQFCSKIKHCDSFLEGSSFKSTMVIGVRENNLYKKKGQPM